MGWTAPCTNPDCIHGMLDMKFIFYKILGNHDTVVG